MMPSLPEQSMVALAALSIFACTKPLSRESPAGDRPPARYLFAWAGDEDRHDSDFLAVIDLAPHGDRYGTIVATAPIGERGIWPHHTEHELGPSRTLFANGFSGNRNVLFDLHDPMHPKVIARFYGVAGLSFLHSFARLANGHVLATFQSHERRVPAFRSATLEAFWRLRGWFEFQLQWSSSSGCWNGTR